MLRHTRVALSPPSSPSPSLSVRPVAKDRDYHLPSVSKDLRRGDEWRGLGGEKKICKTCDRRVSFCPVPRLGGPPRLGLRDRS